MMMMMMGMVLKNAVPTSTSNNEKTSPGFKVCRERISPSVIMLWGDD
jgi:hypothetical protein